MLLFSCFANVFISDLTCLAIFDGSLFTDENSPNPFKKDSILKEEIPTKGIDVIFFCTCHTSLRIFLSTDFPETFK